DGQGGYYLMVSGTQTGADNAIQSISVSGNSTLASAIGYTAGSTSGPLALSSQHAQDASLTVNGVPVTSATNTIQNVVSDVTLTLNSVTASGSSDTLNVTSDPSVITTAVQSFVTAYNALQSTISSLTAFNTTNQTSSPLTGDNTTLNVQTSLASALQVFVGTGTLQSLADLGITTDPETGQLDLDTSKLSDAITSNPTDVANLFTGPSGLAASIQSATNNILGATNSLGAQTSTGSIENAESGLQQTISDLDNQYTNEQSRITDEMNMYRTEFTNLDTLVSQMNNTSSYLTQQFAAMTNSSSSN
ncbi:MAG TPA: flagellar filament capping protein FliD, partial [Rhodopila sp.]